MKDDVRRPEKLKEEINIIDKWRHKMCFIQAMNKGYLVKVKLFSNYVVNNMFVNVLDSTWQSAINIYINGIIVKEHVVVTKKYFF